MTRRKNELMAARLALVAGLSALADKPSLTADEVTQFEKQKAECELLSAQIARADYVAGVQAEVDRVPAVPRPTPIAPTAALPGLRVVENPGIANIGELLFLARFRPQDQRLQALQEMQTGEGGGFAVPDDIRTTLLEVKPSAAIYRPRATVFPAMPAEPDADLVLPALNQGSGKGMYGGVAMAWLAEGGDISETGAKLREIRWTPREVAGYLTVTDKLLRNWGAASATFERLLRNALTAAEDDVFHNANGVSRPLGVLASGALKKVNRATASTVKYVDLAKMEAEAHDEGKMIWVVNPRVIPVLRQMESTLGQLIWTESARDGAPSTLLGRPVVVNYRSPALGSLGDVVLEDPQYYVIKDGYGPVVAASEHVLFKQNKTLIKISRAVGGGPWLDAPLAQEDGQTYSPFVALDVPA